MAPSLSGPDGYRVGLIGEALGEDEAEVGSPFVGRAGFRLSRLIEWAGLERSKFDIWNLCWCRPPGNKLEGTTYETPAALHCRAAHWQSLIARNRVLVPMGNVALGHFTGRKGILTLRGYVQSGPGSTHLLPTVHPSFIQRGQSKWSAPFIADLQKAVELAREGLPVEPVDYLIDPSPQAAYRWAVDYRAYLGQHPGTRLAFDIETPGKGEEEDDVDDESDKSWNIFRIGFSYGPLSALSIPWTPEHFGTIRLLLGSPGEKVVWNAGFDVPRVKRAGFPAAGLIHDGMVAWHILHSDLPKRLGFVATFTCPWQPAWKHLSGSHPGFYNATDADVEWRSMDVIERELKKSGLWDVYQRDVVDLDPVLVHMQDKGMPIDQEVREDRARKLAERLSEVHSTMTAAVPLEARKIAHVYKKQPADTSGLLSRGAELPVTVCDRCGAESPKTDHFKVYKKKSNPCAGAARKEDRKPGLEWYRLADFTPSRDQLIRYHNYLHRPLPMTWDKKEGRKKVSFGEKQIKELIIKYPLDKLYPAVLSYREIDKLAGTYVGRPA